MASKSKLKWKTVKRTVKDLIPLDFNPRIITDEKKEALLRSIEKFDLVEIPCINVDNSIIGGKQRVEALMIAGRGEEIIDVRIPNRSLTEAELKEYMLISNTHAGQFDAELLEVHFNETEIDFDIPVFEETKGPRAAIAPQSTMEKFFFLNIRCEDEKHCQQLFDRLAGEGLEVKIIT